MRNHLDLTPANILDFAKKYSLYAVEPADLNKANVSVTLRARPAVLTEVLPGTGVASVIDHWKSIRA